MFTCLSRLIFRTAESEAELRMYGAVIVLLRTLKSYTRVITLTTDEKPYKGMSYWNAVPDSAERQAFCRFEEMHFLRPLGELVFRVPPTRMKI